MDRIYLDYAATAPVLPEVLDAMLPFFVSAFGNASGIHAEGREARKAVEHASLQDIKTAEAIVGKRRMNTFHNVPDVMAGFGYVAGIAEGKRIERARRRTK